MPERERPKSGLQPKLWLIGTGVVVGVGIGLLGAHDPSENALRPQLGPGFFGVVSAVQALVGRLALRAGKNPKDSLLADLMLDSARQRSVEIEPKPLLWMFAFVLFVLASASFTLCVAGVS